MGEKAREDRISILMMLGQRELLPFAIERWTMIDRWNAMIEASGEDDDELGQTESLERSGSDQEARSSDLAGISKPPSTPVTHGDDDDELSRTKRTVNRTVFRRIDFIGDVMKALASYRPYLLIVR